LNSDWQRHVLASTGYLELRMFDDAALIFQEIATEDNSRNLGPRRQRRSRLFLATVVFRRYLRSLAGFVR
jgi:hypothetical protein